MPTTISPKVIAVCEDRHFLSGLKGDGVIDARKAEELARKAAERHIDISFTCAGTGHGKRKCKAQLKPLKNVSTPSFLLVGGSRHCRGCEYDIETPLPARQLSYRLENFSISDFHESVAKGKNYINTVLAQTAIRDAQNLDELYRKLRNARFGEVTADGYKAEDLIVDSRTYMMHRNGYADINGHPALVLGITTPLYGRTDLFQNDEYINALILQEPFIAPGNKPENRIHYILQFDKRHNSAYKECHEAIIKIAKRNPDNNDEADRRTNNTIFLVEAVWKKIDDRGLLRKLGCKIAFSGVITNKKQFTALKSTITEEDERFFSDRVSIK